MLKKNHIRILAALSALILTVSGMPLRTYALEPEQADVSADVKNDGTETAPSSEYTDPAGTDTDEDEEDVTVEDDTSSESETVSDVTEDESGEETSDAAESDSDTDADKEAADPKTEAITEAKVHKEDLLGATYSKCTYVPSEKTLYLAGNIEDKVSMTQALNGVDKAEITKVIALDGTKLIGDCGSMFSGFSGVTTIDLSKADTSGATDMRSFFSGCSSVKTLDVSNISTASVDSSFGFINFFAGCSSLESITLGGKFSTAGAQKLTRFFDDCSSLKSIDMSKINTASAWDLNYMFGDCSSLKSIDCSSFSISGVSGRGLVGLFSGCSSLTELDLSTWSTGGFNVIANLFNGCTNLRTIYVGNGWRVGHMSSDECTGVFSGCVNLVGGEGTTYVSGVYYWKDYAVVDHGEDWPGLLTGKNITTTKKTVTPVIRMDATLKLDDGSYYRTYSYTGKEVIPEEVWVYEYFSSYSNYLFMEPGHYKKVFYDNINAGKGKVTVYPVDWGMYDFTPVTAEFPIGKASHNDKTYNSRCVFGQSTTVDVADGIEPGASCTYKSVTDANGILDGTPTYADGVLTYRVRNDASLADKKATITLSVGEYGNYKGYSIIINVTATDRAHVDFSWNGSTITGYLGTDKDVVIPKDASAIGEGAFEGNTDITSVRFENGCNRILKNAFKGCTNLKSIELPVNLQEIGVSAFEGSGLTQITIPENVNYIRASAFKDCSSLHSVVKNNGSTYYDKDAPAFVGCSIDEIIINSSNIRDYEFYRAGISKEKEVTVTIPAKVIYIGKYAFAETGIDNVIFEKDCKVTDMYDHVFMNTGIRSVEIPAGLYTLQEGMFKDCTELSEVSFAEGSKLLNMNQEVFKGCSSLSHIVLPEGVKYIYYNAFEASGLTEISIPAGVYTVYSGVFKDCVKLKDIYFTEGTKSVYNGAFEGCKKSLVFHAPEGSYMAKWAKDNGYGEAEPEVQPTISLDHTEKTVYEGGETFELTAVIDDPDSKLTAEPRVTFTSNAGDTIRFLDADDDPQESITVDANASGRAKAGVRIYSDRSMQGVITASIEGTQIKATCKVTVFKPTVTRIDLNCYEVTLDEGEKYSLKAYTYPEGLTTDMTHVSSDETVASVSASGIIEALSAGSCEVTAACTKYPDVKAVCKVTVRASEVEGGHIPSGGEEEKGIWVAGIKDYEYTGSKIVQEDLRVYHGNTLLIKGRDYTVSYKNNLNVPKDDSPKKAPTLTVTLKGQYSGKKSYTFKINKVDITESEECKVKTQGDVSAAAGSKVQKPVPVLTFGSLTLKNNRDFKCSYPDTVPGAYKDPGTYVIAVEGKGNYTGSRTVAVVFTDKGYNLSGAALKAGPVAGKKVYYPGVSGDVCEYDLKVSLKIKGKVIPEDYYDLTVIAPAGHTGKAIVRADVNEQGKNAGYSGYKQTTVTVYPDRTLKKATVEDLASQLVYDAAAAAGSEGIVQSGYKLSFRDDVIVNELTEGVDYTVTYKNNRKTGKASVTFKGIGRYSGSLKKTYKIVPCTSGLTCTYYWDDPAAQTVYYTKGGVTPKVTVTDVKGNVLVAGKEYTAAAVNKSNLKPGDMSVKITGKGNYKGYTAMLGNIRIVNGDFESGKIRMNLSDKAYCASGNAWKSSVSITDSNGKKLTAGTDYDNKVQYIFEGMSEDKKCPDAGAYVYVTAVGKGYYAGSILTGSYRIYTAPLSGLTVKISDKYYDRGRNIELTADDIRVYPTAADAKAEKNRIENTDEVFRILGYSDNLRTGKAKVTIQGVGNYGGTRTVVFKILRHPYR